MTGMLQYYVPLQTIHVRCKLEKTRFYVYHHTQDYAESKILVDVQSL